MFWRDPSGQQRTKSFDRRREAESSARRVEVDKEDGRYSDPALGRVSVRDFWEHFLETAINLRPTTRAKYQIHGRNYIVPMLGNRRLSSLSKADIRSFNAEMVARGCGDATIEATLPGAPSPPRGSG